MERIEGEVKAVLYKPWARYHSAEGITRWQSDIWLLLRWEGQIFPLWIRSTVFTGTDGALSVLTFWGTPAAGRRFSDSILYSLYEMKGDQLMRIFRVLLAVLASMGFFCTAWAAETADLGAIGQVELRKDLSYFSNGSAEAVSIPGGARLDVHPGVLQVHQGKVVLSGRLIYTVLPHEWSQRIIPYFNINLTPDQWQNLSSINMQMYQPDSPLYAMVRQAVMSWTGENVSNRGSQFTIRDFEPLRRMNYTREMIYTAGGKSVTAV